MRPVRIRAQGFGAFREPVEIDLADVDFFALVGPTGAGKSTVIDAMCFALYGSVPRYDDNRAVAPAIALGALEAKVALTFVIDGRTYDVARVARRTPSGGASTKEARLERVEDDGTTTSMAATARDVNTEVVRLVGLPFEHFTKCVVLPQGEFAEFLHAKPAERQDLLVRLLNLGLYAAVGQRARQLAAEAKARVEAHEGRLTALEHVTPEALAAARARAAALDDLRVAIDAQKPRDEELAREVHDQERTAQAARDAAAALGAVTVPGDVRALHERLVESQTRARAAADALAAVEGAVVAAQAAATDLPEPAAVEAALAARADLDACATELDAAAAAAVRAEETLVAAAGALAAADAEAEAAEAAFERARHAHMPHQLAAALVVGEPCPVCEQVVHTLPRQVADTELEAARARHEATRRTVATARDAHANADKALGAAEATRRNLEDRHATLTERAAAFGDDDLDALLAAATEARAVLEAARTRERAARDADRAARDEVATREAALKRVESRFTEQREALVSVGLTPPPPNDDLVTSWEGVATWAQAELPRREAAAAAATTAAEHAREQRGSAFAALADRARAVGVEGRNLAALAEAAAAARTGAQRDVDDLASALAEITALRATISSTRGEQALADELGRRLRSSGFEQWLVEEALTTLVTDATQTLRALSSGAYSLVLEPGSRDLVVVDHLNADERRPVRTLSGGETFQASLALALALSERLADLAADGAARLESIFLDEGFGSLDAGTLETVAATIETLGTDGRMVGIVTHVRELAERVPVRFEVSKVGSTATVARIDT